MNNLDLKVISFNVSGVPDLLSTAERLQEAKNSSVQKAAKDILQPGANLDALYGNQMRVYIHKLIESERPDIICLQELSKKSLIDKYEHAELARALDDQDYDLFCEQDTAIACKRRKFHVVSNKATGNPNSPAYLVDVKEEKSGAVIRFVSDHPEFSENGAKTLKENVESVDLPTVSPFKRLWQRISGLLRSNTAPGLIIYGMDGNATRRIPGELEKPEADRVEWQPERLDIFEKKGFQTDLSDTSPTLRFKQQSQKIDHIYMKALRQQGVSIQHRIVKGLNDPQMLTDPDTLPVSDHLPLIYEIKVKPRESFTSLIYDCFRSIFRK